MGTYRLYTELSLTCKKYLVTEGTNSYEDT